MRPLLLAIVIVITSLYPVASFASGHGGHGGGHCGGHGHGGHGGGHCAGHSTVHFRSTIHAGHYRYGNDQPTALRYPMSGIHEIMAGAGAIPGRQITDELISLSTPANYVTYRYGVTPHSSIGISAGMYTFWGRDTSYRNGSPTLYNYKQTVIAVAVDWRYTLYSGPNAQIYQGLSIGAAHSLEHDTYTDGTKNTGQDYNISGQMTLMGVRVGHALAWYVELGMGYKGVVSGGISYEPNYAKKHEGW